MMKGGGSSFAFLDLLFNTLLCFVMLFAISLMLINPIEDQKKIDVKAEFLITVSWPKDMGDDVDVYVRDPVGNLIYFKDKESGLMHLDRDDLGHKNDIIDTPSGAIEYSENQEVVTLRGVYSGEYIINVHLYSKSESQGGVPVTIEVEKLNPYKKILIKTVKLKNRGDEKTLCRLNIDSDKNVKSISYVFKKLVTSDWDADDYRDALDNYMENSGY